MNRTRFRNALGPFQRLLFFLLLVQSAGQAAVEMRVADVGGQPGETIRVPIQFTADVPIAGLQFELLFSPSWLRSQSVVAGSAASAHEVLSNEVVPGTRRVLVFSSTNAVLSNGLLMEVPLTIQTNALPGQVGLTLTNAVFSDDQGASVQPFTLWPGMLTVSTSFKAPSLVVQPRSQSVTPPTDVTLTVQAEGTGPFTYQWRKNGVNIAGATNDTLVVQIRAAGDGGMFTVIVANAAGAVTSDPADLVINLPPAPEADQFANRIVLAGNGGVLAGTNRFATKEPGEPAHAGKEGGKSVWFTWKAPADGIASFRTSGSTFDTLLGVYTGLAVNALSPVMADDDRGGYLTSALQFNAVAGTEYQIAVDGFAAADGDFILDWTFEPTPQTLPVITLQPASQTVLAGTEVTLQVQALGNGLSFQWLFNGVNLEGATTPVLIQPNLQKPQVGVYTVQVRNSASLTVQSLPAFVEIVELKRELTQDKLNDLLTGTTVVGLESFNSARKPAGFPWVSAGTIGSQLLNNWGATTEAGEPNHAGVIGGASRWLRLTPAETGTLVVDTIGSDIDTVLAVYTGTGISDLKLVAADDNGAPDGIRSVVRFAAQRGVEYLIAVDGVQGAEGAIRVNWQPWRLGAIGGWQGGIYNVVLSGTTAGGMRIEATSDFRQWWPIYTNPAASTPFEMLDPASSSLPARFYRAKSWP